MILLSGDTCAIGREVAACLATHGRPWRPLTTTGAPWRLGDPIGPACSPEVTALIHLGWPRTATSDSTVERQHALLLAELAQAAPAARPVLLSSFAARKGADNSRYGHQKLLVEQQFLAAGGTVVRAGLVWGPQGFLGQRGAALNRVAALGIAPALPGWAESLYLTCVEDLVTCLQRAADLSTAEAAVTEVAGPVPMTLWEAIERVHARPVRTYRVPGLPARAVAQWARRRRPRSELWDTFTSLYTADPPLSDTAVIGRMPDPSA